MNRLRCKSGLGVGLALLCPAVLAATQEEAMATVTQIMVYVFIAFVVVVIAGVYFMKSRDKRASPLSSVFDRGEAVHSVAPDTSVFECVRLMNAHGIGALVVMDGDRVKGIFTERDALKKVLTASLDTHSTKVSEVMTRDPCCVPATTSVGEAMELITTRRFRHLPVVEGGKLLAVVSSGDLTHWLVKDKIREVQSLVGLPPGSEDLLLEEVLHPAQSAHHRR